MIRAIDVWRRTHRSSLLTGTLAPKHQSPSPSQSSCLSPIYVLSLTFATSSLKKQKNKEEDPYDFLNKDPTSPPRLLVVQPRLRPEKYFQAKLNEALCLANSLEEQRDGYFHIDFFNKDLPPQVIVQNPVMSSKPRADSYFGRGTVETIKCHLTAETKGEVDAVFVNALLSGIQQRNLERAWGKPVLDRVGLIIEIFNAHAHSKEAKLQAELAALMYKRSRLVRVRGSDGRSTFGADGDIEVVSARGRGSGGRGFISGAGETELQLQRRRITERRNTLLSQIEEVRRTRALQRAARKKQGGLHDKKLVTVAVVGYTNAGKSTLVSTLSNSDLYSDDRLFATLDPRLKSVVLPSGRKVLLSDTVGFISDLPLQLVKAFHATLEEVVEADLLVHVLDCTAPNLDEHRSTVLQVLRQIGVSDEKLQNMIEVWNKIDYEEEEANADEYLNDGGDAEAENSSMASELSDEGSIDDNVSAADDNASELLHGDLEQIDNKQDDTSNDWLLAEDDDENFAYWNNPSESLSSQMTGKDECEAQLDPDVKISAISGVGLQQLLEIIDERLKTQDEMAKANNVVERSLFDRKWRPSRTEEASVAVEN
ncbi:GTP-binding protein At3g49725, chloroplastic isoform X2 [Tripterygium wilfordii]|uniref:GTP-binding protein At3g49725, chloroplastic isoform X2 n=1 Tax=Tripterygium wilfordii TaxID=458696 RepID=UPI0018F7F4D5|nr:GTP-binding protein At3g49725, chloroplastic isoform X2 [Tripterygium wilfordii]